MEGWLTSDAKKHSVASEKFEIGKACAIYGTANIDYAVMGYILIPLELLMHRIEGIENGLRVITLSAIIPTLISSTPWLLSQTCLMLSKSGLKK